MDDQTTQGMRGPRGPRAEDGIDEERDLDETSDRVNPGWNGTPPQDATQVEDTIPPENGEPGRDSLLGSLADSDIPGEPG
ncbi:MAG TPA: hypothetical protein VGR16_03640 [Thermomicrobiales bacterium]|nr:hypothetical protein [Thermomicrobiales bacterium]